jgi:O-antigen/teichoic acid export membrane protein
MSAALKGWALRSSFARNVGGMMLFTALGQSIYLLTGPLIGRIFSQVDMGLYGLFYTFAVTTIGVLFLNFDFAIPAAATDDDAHRLSRGALIIALLVTPLAGLVMFGLIVFGVSGFGALPMAAPLMLMALLATQAILQLQQNWQVRRHQTLVIGRASITLNFVRGATQVLVGLVMPSWWALGAGEVTGRIGNAVHLLRSGDRQAASGPTLQRRDVLATLRAYGQFPLVLLPAQLLDSASSFIQTAGIAYLFGPAQLGLYFMMRRTLDMPVAFVFRSLSDVFYARLAHDARFAPDRVRPFVIRSVAMIAIPGLLCGLSAMWAAPTLFAWVFGEEWRASGALATLMIPATIANLAVAPAARVFALTSRPQLRFWFSGANLAGTCLVLAVTAFWALDISGLTVALSVATVVSYAIYFISALYSVRYLSLASAATVDG